MLAIQISVLDGQLLIITVAAAGVSKPIVLPKLVGWRYETLNLLSLTFFTHSKRKEWRSSTQMFNLSLNDTLGRIYDCRFWDFKACKKMKNNKFFKKKRKCFCLGKVLSTQTSNLGIGFSVYVDICRILTRIVRVP